MGVDPRAKTMSEANSGRGGGSAKDRLAASSEPGDGDVADAIGVVHQVIEERLDSDPRAGPPKFSLAKLAQGGWVASLNSWGIGYGLSAFEDSPKAALVKLGQKLARGEEWKALPKQADRP